MTEESTSSVFMCPLTLDVETHFPLDNTVGIPDSVASLICTGDGAEGDVALVDADPVQVALPGQARAGQQHLRRSAGEKVKGR